MNSFSIIAFFGIYFSGNILTTALSLTLQKAGKSQTSSLQSVKNSDIERELERVLNGRTDHNVDTKEHENLVATTPSVKTNKNDVNRKHETDDQTFDYHEELRHIPSVANYLINTNDFDALETIINELIESGKMNEHEATLYKEYLALAIIKQLREGDKKSTSSETSEVNTDQTDVEVDIETLLRSQDSITGQVIEYILTHLRNGNFDPDEAYGFAKYYLYMLEESVDRVASLLKKMKAGFETEKASEVSVKITTPPTNDQATRKTVTNGNSNLEA